MKQLAIITDWVLMVMAIIAIIIMAYKLVDRTPKEFEYKKHQYIEFPNKGVVHDPNCKHCQLVFD